MGLDITAYRKLKVAEDAPKIADWKDGDYETYLHFYENSDFPGTMSGLDGNIVFERPEPGELLQFRAGSYSGYGQWRDQLCRMAHGISAKEFWDLGNMAPAAFREIINFSDCEGTIGPVISAKLARDFANFQTTADAYKADDDEGDWWHKAYALWRKAFEMAAEGGAVEFH